MTTKLFSQAARISLSRPSPDRIEQFLQRQTEAPFSYSAVGATRGTPPAGFQFDHYETQLGHGEATFLAARRAIDSLRMFPAWVSVSRLGAATRPEPKQLVGVLAWQGGLWFLNVCRVVHVIDETAPAHRYGFAYGTLPAHAERGEEAFVVEWRGDDSVWYVLEAFSRPAHPLARLGHLWARRLQKRFGRDSLAAMRAATGAATPTEK